MTQPHQANPADTFLEQYKSYVGDLGNIGNRHADTTKFYVSLLSALVVFQSLAEKIGTINLSILTITLSVAGIVICTLWGLTTGSYSKLYRAKLDVLRELEDHLSYPSYKIEWEKLQALGFTPVSSYERFAAGLLALLFILVLAARLIAA